MSILDSIKNVGSDAARFGGNVLETSENFGSDALDFGSDAGRTIKSGFQTVEQAAVKTQAFQAGLTRFALEKTFSAGSGAVSRLSFPSIDFTPGADNPPPAQNLQFSETKGASSLAYDAKQGEVYKFADGKQWQVVDVSEDKSCGFRAIALKPVDPNDRRIIVAFAGTDPKSGKDIFTDLGQATGFQTRQYADAVGFAQKWQTEASSSCTSITLTGHSLGGGLAAYASIKTGMHATTMNAAPLALNHIGGNPFDSNVRNNPNITNYAVPGEILTTIDGENPLDMRPGNLILVEGKHSILNPLSPILNHMTGNIAPDVALPEKVN